MVLLSSIRNSPLSLGVISILTFLSCVQPKKHNRDFAALLAIPLPERCLSWALERYRETTGKLSLEFSSVHSTAAQEFVAATATIGLSQYYHNQNTTHFAP